MAIRPPSNLLLFVNNYILLFFVSDENPPEVSGCLHQIYPKLASQLEYFRVVERCLTLFRHFVGVRMSNKMGPTSFRMMARYGGVFLFSKWKLSTMVIIPWYKLYSQLYCYICFRAARCHCKISSCRVIASSRRGIELLESFMVFFSYEYCQGSCW